jgi:hypothetical protein
MSVLVRVAVWAAAACAVAQGARSGARARAQQQLGAKVSPSAEEQADVSQLLAVCQDTQFAYCGMATCETTPVGGNASCACWVGYGESIAPGPLDGAQTTNQTDLCETMKTTLYSTAPNNASQSVPTAPAGMIVTCPVETVSVEVAARRAGWRLAAARRREAPAECLRRRSLARTWAHRWGSDLTLLFDFVFQPFGKCARRALCRTPRAPLTRIIDRSLLLGRHLQLKHVPCRRCRDGDVLLPSHYEPHGRAGCEALDGARHPRVPLRLQGLGGQVHRLLLQQRVHVEQRPCPVGDCHAGAPSGGDLLGQLVPLVSEATRMSIFKYTSLWSLFKVAHTQTLAPTALRPGTLSIIFSVLPRVRLRVAGWSGRAGRPARARATSADNLSATGEPHRRGPDAWPPSLSFACRWTRARRSLFARSCLDSTSPAPCLGGDLTQFLGWTRRLIVALDQLITS